MKPIPILPPAGDSAFAMINKVCIFAILAIVNLGCKEQDQTFSQTQVLEATENVETIIKKFNAEKAIAMEVYLVSNPGAEDAPKIFEELISYYEGIDDKKRLLDVLERQYARLPKGLDGDFQTASANWQKRFFAVWHRQVSTKNDLEKSKAIFDQIRNDFPQSHNDGWFIHQESKLKLPCVGDKLEIAFTAMDGRTVDLRDMQGKVVLVHYWRTAEENDLRDLAQIKSLYERYHADGLDVIGICLDEDKNALERVIDEEKISWPQAFDGKGFESPLAEKYFAFFTPFNLLIGRDGKMSERNLEGSELDNCVKALIQ